MPVTPQRTISYNTTNTTKATKPLISSDTVIIVLSLVLYYLNELGLPVIPQWVQTSFNTLLSHIAWTIGKPFLHLGQGLICFLDAGFIIFLRLSFYVASEKPQISKITIKSFSYLLSYKMSFNLPPQPHLASYTFQFWLLFPLSIFGGFPHSSHLNRIFSALCRFLLFFSNPANFQ